MHKQGLAKQWQWLASLPQRQGGRREIVGASGPSPAEPEKVTALGSCQTPAVRGVSSILMADRKIPGGD